MARIFKTSSGLPLAIYIEPSCPNRPGLLKSILANGGAPAPRIEKANVILVDAQTRNGRECARNQLDTGSERIVLFVEWIEACVSAGKLLGEDVDWGNLRIQDPEIVDESLYEEPGDSHVPHVKQDIKEEDHADTKHRPWPTPTSPTRLPGGELPVSSGAPTRTTATPPLNPETHTAVCAPSHYAESPRQSSTRYFSASLSPRKSSEAPSPAPTDYGRLPTDPEYSALFLSSCEEWERIKREGQAYTRLLAGPTVPESQLGPHTQQARTKKRRSPLPAGSTKRGPKRRESQVLPGDFTSLHLNLPSESQPLGMRLENDSDDKLFTFGDEPMQFWLQIDLPDRRAVIKSIRDHGGTTAFKMEDAAYIIVSRSAPQYQELAQEAEAIDRIAVPVAWIRKCIEEQQIVSYEEDIINAAMADLPPSPAPSSSSVGNKKPGHRFTEHDQEFLQKRLAWTYARDPVFSLRAFFQDLHQTTRSTLGWRTIIAQQPMRSASDTTGKKKKQAQGCDLVMLQRTFRAYGLILFAAGALIGLSVTFQQRLSLDDLFWESTPNPNVEVHVESTYRQQLASVRDIDNAPHSRTLGVAQRVYVIGLPRRKDRRQHMETLIRAMDIDVVWHDALDMHSKLVTDILERVRWVRAQSRIGHESQVPDPQGLVFKWLPDVGSDAPVPAHDGSDLWFIPGRIDPLRPRLSPIPDRCWYSHYQVLLKIARGEDQVAIVLEDDVDMEWDLEKRLRGMWAFLPKDWDIVMLGHCMSSENENPPVRGHPHLHPSKHVLCTHAYAVSRSGARKLVRYLRTPLFAFSRPIDHAVQHFNHHKILNIYSVEPAVVIQTKDTVSDIVDGTGGSTEWLADSALQRVAYYEKLLRQQQKHQQS
ncbi:hypothetical protein RHS01_01025 [Rhizoctonia solani]|uniref:BRCT domain-containing protein n=1 Tax=Rhizoctonia solani TaxID=456999 RepID=A0A8H7M9A5_9AGAM|nr:hypothetical protein RHS01_01025 [Rhizoctonia solani]